MSRAGSSQQGGFSLIELMVAVAIIGVLLAVAFPSYQSSVQRGHRTQASADLIAAAQDMERAFATNLKYPETTSPPFATASPKDGVAVYVLSISARTSNTFTLRATPVSGGPADSTGNIELTSTGIRRWDKNADGSYSANEATWEE